MKSIHELSSLFNSRMGEFEKNIQQPGANTTVKSLTADFYTFKSFVWKTIGMLKSQVELLHISFDRLEMHSRRKVLLFHGVKEDVGEDTCKKVSVILSDQLKLSGISNEAFESCHRLGAKRNTARPILVRFTTVHLRSMVWKAKTALKGSKTSISEFLTKPRQDVFVAARAHFGMKRCWSADGVIVVLLPDKNRKKIVSLAELKLLTSQYTKDSSS